MTRGKGHDSICYLEFSVIDTGIGITPEVQKNIFEPLYQGVGSDTRKHGGIGLGLSIAFKIANLLNGRISFKSKEGEGSIFNFRIPSIISKNQRKNTAMTDTIQEII